MKTATMKSEAIRTGSPKNTNTQSISTVRPRFLCAIAIAIMLWLAVSAASAQTVLYTFNNQTGDVNAPKAALIADSAGNLYGTASLGGPYDEGGVFELSPPAVSGGQWTETTLYAFTGGADGGQPIAALVMDANGALYGTTEFGDNLSFGSGVVFKLSPPEVQGGSWTESVLHSFSLDSDGDLPSGPLVFDKSGNLYGTAFEGGSGAGGTVFQLTPPSTSDGTWGFNVLLNFVLQKDAVGGCYPVSGLLIGPSGSLFGTTKECGTRGGGVAFSLTPPTSGGQWTEKVIHTFGFLNGTGDGTEPEGSLVAGAGGVLFGTTVAGGSSGVGTVYELSPPSTKSASWTETILHDFDTTDGSWPVAPVTVTASVVQFGTTWAGGTGSDGVVFKLTPPTVSGGSWTESPLVNFTGATGADPLAGLLLLKGSLYGTAAVYGSGFGSVGTVYKIF